MKWRLNVFLLVIVSLDRFLKWTVTRDSLLNTRDFFYGIFSFGFFPNEHIFFLFSFSSLLFRVLWILFFLIVVVWFFVSLFSRSSVLTTGLFSIVLGALSNGIDRFSVGFVIDYVIVGRQFFLNIADLLIIFGIGLLVFAYRRSDISFHSVLQ